MPHIAPKQAGSRNMCAYLDTLAFAEIGSAMLAASDDGYDLLVGSLPGRLKRFDSYADHPLPRKSDAIQYAKGVWSTAAGRYQILSRYWRHYQKQLSLPDFGPVSQDRYAIQQIKEQRALDAVHAGKIDDAIRLCSNIWASLPGAGYGQHEHTMGNLIVEFVNAGGILAPEDALHWFDELKIAGRRDESR